MSSAMAWSRSKVGSKHASRGAMGRDLMGGHVGRSPRTSERITGPSDPDVRTGATTAPDGPQAEARFMRRSSRHVRSRAVRQTLSERRFLVDRWRIRMNAAQSTIHDTLAK